MKRKTGIIISAIVVTGLLVTGAIIFILNNQGPKKPFRLDDEYYAKSEAITIKKDEYEKLIEDKKTFLIMIDKPGCVMTADMMGFMADFPDDMQFKYYRMLWEDVAQSSLHEYVKFTPSMAVVYEGKVIDWLQADKDEDADYFNNADALQSWIREYIAF
ncbi:hypothetical protein IKG50_03120 [Candidatus Saccharibacteria bacterium]|jgi:hypothetical protein|nr:hypothetical protein [Candidatus Saccharibacteria bacterium]